MAGEEEEEEEEEDAVGGEEETVEETEAGEEETVEETEAGEEEEEAGQENIVGSNNGTTETETETGTGGMGVGISQAPTRDPILIIRDLIMIVINVHSNLSGLHGDSILNIYSLLNCFLQYQMGQ
ncbi:unnamed protein product [Ophioblennius macclurei]